MTEKEEAHYAQLTDFEDDFEDDNYSKERESSNKPSSHSTPSLCRPT